VVCGCENDDVFSVLSPGLFLKLGASRQENSDSSAGTRNACVSPWCGSPEYFCQWTLGVLLFARGRETFKKILSYHLKLSTEGGGRFQGVGVEDAAMVEVVPNCLLWSKRGWSLRIPP
jgi:hypothetical protein